MSEIEAIIERMIDALGVKTKGALAKKLGISNSAISQWVVTDTIPSAHIEKVAQLSGRSFESIRKDVVAERRIEIINKGWDIVEIPYYVDARASMGGGIQNYESSKKKLSFDISFLREVYHLHCTKGLSLVNAYGDSMAPTIPSDSIVFVQDTDIQDGSICAVLIDNEMYIKRIQKRPVLKFISDNKKYDDIYIDEKDVKIIGKVIGIFKRM